MLPRILITGAVKNAETLSACAPLMQVPSEFKSVSRYLIGSSNASIGAPSRPKCTVVDGCGRPVAGLGYREKSLNPRV